MKRCEVWWAEFSEAAGGEIRKRRPVVIVSNNASNQHLNRVQVIPVTSSVSRIYPSEAAITVRKVKSKAMADQLTTISKHRLAKRIGRVTPDEMERIEIAIQTQLGLRCQS